MSMSKVLICTGRVGRLAELDLSKLEERILAVGLDFESEHANAYTLSINCPTFEPIGELKKSSPTYGPPRKGKGGKIKKW